MTQNPHICTQWVRDDTSDCVIEQNGLNKFINGTFENASIDSDRPNSFMGRISPTISELEAMKQPKIEIIVLKPDKPLEIKP